VGGCQQRAGKGFASGKRGGSKAFSKRAGLAALKIQNIECCRRF
jgi:hypothetical protein